MNSPRLLIITGSSGVGKSTLTAKISTALGFGKIAATDTVREVLRTQFDSIEKPALHRSSFESAGGTAVADWEETVEVLSEGVRAVIERAQEKGGDLLLEGVHYSPGSGCVDSWKNSGGRACGVVLHVSDEERHKEMICKREKHNGRKLDHYLGNFDRIREIQEVMVDTGSQSGWLLIDPTIESDVIAIISDLLN